MRQDPRPDPPRDITSAAAVELERAAGLDHEARLQVLEDLYRSLEGELEASGAAALQ